MTVINETLAWDISGDKDPSECIDVDPNEIYGNAQKITMEELIRMAESENIKRAVLTVQ